MREHILYMADNPSSDAFYFSRRFAVIDISSPDKKVDETGLLALTGNKIVLGEPGLGKSKVMEELARQIGIKPVTAIRFINAKNPQRLVHVGKPLLIDGLDEAMSRREGDAVDAILAQLEEAGSPAFILSCRSREWQARNLTTLRQLYDADPTIVTLEPLDRTEAYHYLAMQNPDVDANHVLDHLATHNLDELYRNPLTLNLMGRVAERDRSLPATRGALFERACALIWPEHNSDRQDSELAQLTEHQALNAAGAIAASSIFAGAEAASAAGAAQARPSDLRLVEIETLPQSQAAPVIFTSKLFQSCGSLRAKPIHRVIAEYLGARWLARQANSPRTQRRLLSQLHSYGTVPSSLRGLHAWLAYHSSTMAEEVISADPYGVLRYGETAALTPYLADCLFEALCALAKNDPWFRAADWGRHTAEALMIPVLKPKIASIVESTTNSLHLRSLFIEGFKYSSLAAELTDTLENIVLSQAHTFSERSDAVDALLPYRDLVWCRTTVTILLNQASHDAPQLARHIIQHINADVTDEQLATTLFTEMGIINCPIPRKKNKRFRSVWYYQRLFESISSDRLTDLLDLIIDYTELIHDADWTNLGTAADIVAQLLVRAIEETKLGALQAAAVWRWLGVIERAHCSHHDIQKILSERLSTNASLRHAIQSHALENDRRGETLSETSIYMQRRLVGLLARPEDLAQVLDRLLQNTTTRPDPQRDWIDLLNIGWHPDGLSPEGRAAVRAFGRGNKLVTNCLHLLDNPETPAWKIQQEEENAKRGRERQESFSRARIHYENMRVDLRTGILNAIQQPAKAYFDHFRDLPSETPPHERLAEWLGPNLRDDALVGLEAVLHRSDLPTATEIATGFAHDEIYKYSYAIMAGFYERMRNGRGIADLSEPVKKTALLLCYDNHGWNLESEKQALLQALETDVVRTPTARLSFARLWIEPALVAAKEYVPGLHLLVHNPDWQATGAILAAEWLITFHDIPEKVEAILIDCLIHSGAFNALCNVAEMRKGTILRNFRHMLFWLAIDILVRFEKTLPDIEGIGARNPEFIWFLRNRFQFERRGKMLPLSIKQAEWIIREFRKEWPYAVLEGSSTGDENDYDATDFLRSLVNLIANDTSVNASNVLQRLIGAPTDSYSDLIRHAAAEQRQKRAEKDFTIITPGTLSTLLEDGPPGNIEDLKNLVLEEMDIARRKFLGDDLDTATIFWSDSGIPRDENTCRDRLAAIISPDLGRYNIQRITEADMPMTKRADLAFACGTMQLPVEIKGQWHKDVWDAATDQLDVQYLVDWRSEQRGIYCVLWFGDTPSSTRRRLKSHPDGVPAPTTADEMRDMLIVRIPTARRALIDVVVFDFTAGNPGAIL